MAITAVAAVNLLVGLGSSSLFVDEAFSWAVSRATPGGDLYSSVRASEVASPLYYALLYFWTSLTGSESEAGMRLLSVLAALGLVAAVAWLAAEVGGRRAGILGGLLAACSPFVLTYGTQVRAYVFCMLAAVISVAAASRALDRTERSRRWLAVSGSAAVLALWFHYSAVLVIAPLAAWIVTRRALPGRQRLAYAAGLVLAQALVTPLLLSQIDNYGAASFGGLTWRNAIAVVASIFDGRYFEVLVLEGIGALAVISLLAFLWRLPLDHARPLAVLATVPILALLALTLLGREVLLSRYGAAGVGVGLAAVAVAVAAMPRARMLGVAVVVLGLAVFGSVVAHAPSARYPDVSGAFEAIGSKWRSGDAIVVAPTTRAEISSQPLTDYYDARRLPPRADVTTDPGAAGDRLGSAPRVWIVREPPISRRLAARGLRPFGLRPLRLRTFPGSTELQLILAGRTGRRFGR